MNQAGIGEPTNSSIYGTGGLGNGLIFGPNGVDTTDVNGLFTYPTTGTGTGITGSGSGYGTFQGVYGTGYPGLASVLGESVKDFTILPSTFMIGSGGKPMFLADILSELNNIPFMQMGAEIAIAHEVYQAIMSYAKMGEDFAGLSIKEYLGKVLARE